MDHIPVYEGDDSDDGSIKLSPGKIQRTGAKSIGRYVYHLRARPSWAVLLSSSAP
jgi:hypothetical protein